MYGGGDHLAVSYEINYFCLEATGQWPPNKGPVYCPPDFKGAGVWSLGVENILDLTSVGINDTSGGMFICTFTCVQ